MTVIQNAFSLIAVGWRCGGVEAELPAAYSFRNSGEDGAEWLLSGIGLKAFCKRDYGGIGNVEREAEADNDECVLEHIRPCRWAGNGWRRERLGTYSHLLTD